MTNSKDLEAVRSVSIATILGMKDLGRRISIRCPFHSEKSPSCVVYPDNSFHCYGCQAHGNNAVDFVMKLGYSFKDAINELKKYI